MITGYSKALRWKLASSAPGLHGPMERLSDYSFRHRGTPPYAQAFIEGGTPLASGAHAWRVRSEPESPAGEGEEVQAILGIVQAGKTLSDYSYCSPPFYGVCTFVSGNRYIAGLHAEDSGLEVVRSGEALDLLLDADGGRLTVITLKDGKRCDFILPTNAEWVPHFFMPVAGSILSAEVISPEQAGVK